MVVILDTEAEFSKALADILPSRISIFKSQFQYCPIDFILINHQTIKTLYLEHKRRFIIGSNFCTFWIKKAKIQSILSTYKEFLFVNECDDYIYYIWVNELTIPKYKIETNQYGEVVVNIDIADCVIGYDALKDAVLKHI